MRHWLWCLMILVLASCPAFGDLLTFTTATQSTTNGSHLAALAIDSDLSTWSGTTEAGTDPNPYWLGDLGALWVIESVTIWPRQDLEAQYYYRWDGNTLAVIGDLPNPDWTTPSLWSAPVTYTLETAWDSQTFAPGATGRYVRVTGTGSYPLDIAQIQVTGHAATPATVPEPGACELTAFGVLLLGFYGVRRTALRR